MTLTEFLFARIAEDEARVDGIHQGSDPDFFWGPDRIRAECDTKRRIVERCGQQASYLFESDEDDDLKGGWSEAVYMAADVLAAIALPYADHPEYRVEWKP